MLKLSFHQTKAEAMVRAAATIVFDALSRAGFSSIPLSKLADHPQYGFTASASELPIGPKFVRITDLHDAGIDWETVPFCKCEEPEKYLLHPSDLLFARTGATTGKTVLVTDPPEAVFASYLIRVRPRQGTLPEYLYSFFQSDAYWLQISDSKEGSAQPNVNGQKLLGVTLPIVDAQTQASIATFLRVVRARQQGSREPLTKLPPPLEAQRRIVSRIEELAAKVDEANTLRQETKNEADELIAATIRRMWANLVGRFAVRPILEILDFEGGSQPPKHTFRHEPTPGYIRFLQIRDFSSDDYPTYIPISPRNSLVRSEEVLVGRYGASLGKILRGKEGAYNVAMCKAVPKINGVDLDFLACSLAYGPFQDRLAEINRSAQAGFNKGDLRDVMILLPPLPEQRRIVSYLNDLQVKVETLKTLHRETSAELDALLPSILDKAFRGEL